MAEFFAKQKIGKGSGKPGFPRLGKQGGRRPTVRNRGRCLFRAKRRIGGWWAGCSLRSETKRGEVERSNEVRESGATFWHNLDPKEVAKLLRTDIKEGLSEKEIEIRQREFGKNKLPEEKPLSRLRIFFEQFRSPLIYILVIAGLITLVLREYTDSIVIFGAVILNTIVGYFQENKACKALRELKKVVKIEAKVIREGNKRMIDSEDLVPGDIVILTPGNKVPADGRLIESHNLKINEAPLTGEWLPAEKNIEVLPEETPMGDRDNMVYMGCVVEDGKGKAVVTEIGKNTEIGKVAVMVKEAREEKTPLQKKLAHFSKIVGAIIALICIFIFLGGIIREKAFLEMFTISVAVAVAAIPEGLPVAMTVILALGVERILRKKGLVRKLLTAETLGSTSIACTDKTLTLTEGKMELSEVVTTEKFTQSLALQIATLCNEAFIENPQDFYPLWRIRGRPTDRALVLAGAKAGISKPELEKKYPRIDEVPFNPINKFIVNLHQTDRGFSLYVSGAPEKILAFSQLDKKLKEDLQNQLERLTGKGMRVLGVAYRDFGGKPEYKKLEDLCQDLIFVGLIGLKNPLRKEAKEAINICKKAGMKPILVTGDHLLTAKAVAKELGLKTKKENIIEGRELDELSNEEFQKRVEDIEIYARVEPKHKMRIIRAWQEKGQVVAMTGDGINDAPALKQADIGIALGSGTDVAKEVSDLVLLTDNFNIIPTAVEEGRVIIDNIRKVITYLLSDSFTESILVGVSVIFGWPLPVTAVQILWVNLIEDGFPNIALTFEPKEKDVMERKPEGKATPLLTQEMKVIIFIVGIFTDLILLGLFLWLWKGNTDIQYVRTMIFACVGIDSLFYIFSCKSLRRNIWQINPFSNKFLVGTVLFGFLMLVGGIYFPVFQTLLKTVPLGFQDWLILIGLGTIEVILLEAAKWYFIGVRHVPDTNHL